MLHSGLLFKAEASSGAIVCLRVKADRPEQFVGCYACTIDMFRCAQILLLIRQMEATSTQALAAKVSAITIGQQAIIDAYMCLAHLTAGTARSLRDPERSTRSSLWAVASCSCSSGSDLCVAARAAGIMVEPLFNNFATVAFFEFIVFAIFEMRFLLTVWRARRSNNADIWQVSVSLQISVCVTYAGIADRWLAAL